MMLASRLTAFLLRDGLLLPALVLVLAACESTSSVRREPAPVVDASRPPPMARPALPEPVPPATPQPLPDEPYEQRVRSQAESMMQARQWSEAAARWEVLALLRPERMEYARNRDEAYERANEAANQSQAEAANARRQGNTQRAIQLYLKALSEDPQHGAAANALREIDQEQASRLYFNHAARAGNGMRSTGASQTGNSKEREELDTGVMLFHQGDYSASVQSLQAYLKRYPQDDAGKRALWDAYLALAKQRLDQGRKEEAFGYLDKARAIKPAGKTGSASGGEAVLKEAAQSYYEQGLRLQRTDIDAAINAWQRALELDPGHAQAQLRLDQAQRLRQSLQALPETK